MVQSKNFLGCKQSRPLSKYENSGNETQFRGRVSQGLGHKKRVEYAGVWTPVGLAIFGIGIVGFIGRKEDDMFRERQRSKIQRFNRLSEIPSERQIPTRRITKKTSDADVHK